MLQQVRSHNFFRLIRRLDSQNFSVANNISMTPADLQQLEAQLRTQGYATESQLPVNEMVLLDDVFVGE